mmetsp:Transcript_23431/g.23070  ORF Transcript_23431/g.23070 Transcript_23431/m.23070 type:complete len:150 (+) Transcript_23431:1392-1841(+)
MKRANDKLYDQIRELKEENSMKFDSIHKEMSSSSSDFEEKVRALAKEKEALREETEGLRRKHEELRIEHQEASVKLESYQRDYERYFDENRRLKEVVGTLREEKESALYEVRRLKQYSTDRVSEVSEEANLKIGHLENILVETKEKNRF